MESTVQNLVQAEEIEGLDRSKDISWADYLLDTVLIRHETRTVFEILRRLEQGSFILNPEFQRDFIWDEYKQSKFIESVLIPIKKDEPLYVTYIGSKITKR